MARASATILWVRFVRLAIFWGKDRELTLEAGDLLAIRSSGAYGFSMSSNYNTRPRVAEVMVDGDQMFVVRLRETIQSLFANESILAQ